MRTLVILFMSLSMLACYSATSTETEPLLGKIGENIDIPHGRSVLFSDNGLEIHFLDVDDSRCIRPDIQCVWFGNAAVQFRIGGEVVNLNTAAAPSYPSEIVIGDFTIMLLALAPHETDIWPIDKKHYIATIQVNK